VNRLFVILSLIALAVPALAVNHDHSALDGSGSISGTVTDAVTGDPIEGAKVSTGCCNSKYAYTNEDGEYTIEGLAAGQYRMKATMDGYERGMYPGRVTVEESQQVTGVDFELVPNGGGSGDGSISGAVYDKETGLPIADAKVMAGTCRNGRTAYTNEDGEYTITDLADGEYQVKASKDGYRCTAYPETVVIEGGNAVEDIDIWMVPRCQDALD
jgi:uncharacterized surface anchored protein